MVFLMVICTKQGGTSEDNCFIFTFKKNTELTKRFSNSFLPDENEIGIIIPRQIFFKNSIIYLYMHQFPNSVTVRNTLAIFTNLQVTKLMLADIKTYRHINALDENTPIIRVEVLVLIAGTLR